MLESSTYRYILQQGFELGFEQGARESTIEGILEALEIRFHTSDVQTLKPMLESIEELQHLKDLRRAAMQVSSLDAFKHLLIPNGVELRERFVKVSQELLDEKKSTKPMEDL
jgi:hypothetical protein